MTSEKQWRATFEDTKTNQRNLRRKLDLLIDENRAVENEVEREEFIELLSNSTIGLGTDPVKIRLGNRVVIEVPNLEQFIYELLYVKSNNVDSDFFYYLTGKQHKCVIPIKDLWVNIRRYLFAVFPLAKAHTIRMSKEREKKEASPGADIGDV